MQAENSNRYSLHEQAQSTMPRNRAEKRLAEIITLGVLILVIVASIVLFAFTDVIARH